MTVIKNIFWEVDGVLFDTYPAITYVISKSLKDRGLTIALNEIDSLTRQSIDHCLATLCRRFKLDPVVFRLQFEESCLKIPPERQPPLPGARDVCAFIQSRGMNVIVTHRTREGTSQLLAAHGLESYFAGMISAEQGYIHKPAPDMLHVALQTFGLNKMDTLVVGSHEFDIQAGKAAGLCTCHFGSAHNPEPAGYYFGTFGQLLDWLKLQK